MTTILDVQPRLGGGSGGKSNDEIVFELSEAILEKIIDKLDIEEAKQDMFELDDKGRMQSLTTVLVQEVDRFNKLLKVVKVSTRVACSRSPRCSCRKSTASTS